MKFPKDNIIENSLNDFRKRHYIKSVLINLKVRLNLIIINIKSKL